MMRLTKDKKIILVAVPRTRSQWIWKSLEGELLEDLESFFELNSVNRSVHNGRKTWPPHTPNRLISRELLLERHTYEKFTVIRNPWERYASFYSRLRKPLEIGAEEYAKKTQDASAVNKHAMSDIAMQLNFEQFMVQIAIGNRSFDAAPALSFLLNHKGSIDIDHIFRFEDVEAIRNFFIGRGYSFKDVPIGSPQREWRSVHTPVTKRIIGSLCEIEIEQFGYSFD